MWWIELTVKLVLLLVGPPLVATAMALLGFYVLCTLAEIRTRRTRTKSEWLAIRQFQEDFPHEKFGWTAVTPRDESTDIVAVFYGKCKPPYHAGYCVNPVAEEVGWVFNLRLYIDLPRW